jgi:hypothetical protein
VDLGKKIAIWTAEGHPEKTAKLQKGPRGFCIADFGWGAVVTETPNLLYDVEPEQVRKRPAAAQEETKKEKTKKVAKFSHASQSEDVEDLENTGGKQNEAVELEETGEDQKVAETDEKEIENLKKETIAMGLCPCVCDACVCVCVFVCVMCVCVCVRACSAGDLIDAPVR